MRGSDTCIDITSSSSFSSLPLPPSRTFHFFFALVYTTQLLSSPAITVYFSCVCSSVQPSPPPPPESPQPLPTTHQKKETNSSGNTKPTMCILILRSWPTCGHSNITSTDQCMTAMTTPGMTPHQCHHATIHRFTFSISSPNHTSTTTAAADSAAAADDDAEDWPCPVCIEENRRLSLDLLRFEDQGDGHGNGKRVGRRERMGSKSSSGRSSEGSVGRG